MSRNNIKRSAGGAPTLVFGSQKNALVSIGTSANQPKAIHQESKANIFEETGKKDWILWGSNDDFPRDIVKLIRKSTVGKAGLHLLTKSIYGQKLMTYTVVDYNAQGQEVIKYEYNEEWETIIRQSNFNAVRLALMQDYMYFGWNVPEIRFNGNKTKVWGIDYHKTSHCRMAQADPKTGRIPNLYISGNFPIAAVGDCLNIPVIDFIRYPDQLEEIKSNTRDFKYVMPQLWPDPLNDYYPSVYWDSARESGWLEIATSIPAYKKALFKNQMSLKYDIQIPYEYLETMHPGFSKFKEEAQDTIIDALYDEIVTNLTGADNAQKALMSFFKTDKNGKPMGNWIIQTIDDKMKNDAYLPDAAAANSEILLAMNVNPARTGQGNTGGNYGGGSNNGGSNIREADLAIRSQLQADRDIVYSFFEFVKLYNGMDPKLKLAVQDQVMTTLDTGGGTKKVVS